MKDNLKQLLGEITSIKDLGSIRLGSPDMNSNNHFYSDIKPLKISRIDDYIPAVITNHIKIDKPTHVLLPNDYLYKDISMDISDLNYLASIINGLTDDKLDEFRSFVHNRIDILSSIMRKLFLAGNGHFKTKSMSVDYTMIENVCDYYFNGNKPDADLQYLVIGDGQHLSSENKDLLTDFLYLMLSQNKLISTKTKIKRLLVNADYDQASQIMKDFIKKTRLLKTFEQLNWPVINNGEFNIITAAQAFRDVIEKFAQNYKITMTYYSAYNELLPVIRLVLLKREDLLTHDYKHLLENPQFKVLTTTANIMYDALRTVYNGNIAPSYTLASAIEIIYDSLFSNEYIMVKSDLDVRRMLDINVYKDPIMNYRKVVDIKLNVAEHINIKHYIKYTSGKLSMPIQFDKLDDLTSGMVTNMQQLMKDGLDIIDGLLKRTVHKDSDRTLILRNMNNDFIDLIAMLICSEMYISKADNDDVSVLYLNTIDNKNYDDPSLVGMGNIIITNDSMKLLFYSALDQKSSDILNTRNQIYVDHKAYYLGKDLDKVSIKNVFKREQLIVRIPHPVKLDKYHRISMEMSLGDVLLAGNFIRSLCGIRVVTNELLLKDSINIYNSLATIRSMVAPSNEEEGELNSTSKLYIRRASARFLHKLMMDITKSAQANAVNNYVMTNGISHINSILKTDSSMSEYVHHIGDRAEYDLKLLLSMRYATGLWLLRLYEFIGEESISDIYDILIWYIQNESDVDFSPVTNVIGG